MEDEQQDQPEPSRGEEQTDSQLQTEQPDQRFPTEAERAEQAQQEQASPAEGAQAEPADPPPAPPAEEPAQSDDASASDSGDAGQSDDVSHSGGSLQHSDQSGDEPTAPEPYEPRHKPLSDRPSDQEVHERQQAELDAERELHNERTGDGSR